MVFPFAKQAAIIKFSVAPTDIFGKRIVVPISPFDALARTYPSKILNLTPSFDKALRCRLTGLVPIAHPPANETFAFPN